MLIKLAKIVKKSFRNLGKRGYTLVEVAAVVAVTATMAAVVVPVAMDKVAEGKKMAALQDCRRIGNAIISFYRDTGIWPAYNGTATNYYAVLRSGDKHHDDPKDPNGYWRGPRDFLQYHLVVDYHGYLTKGYNWKGPYSESLTKRDPWGNNYLVYIKGMHTATTGGAKKYGWIISAGPNGEIETPVTSDVLGGDDIGYYPYAAEVGH